MNIAAIILVLTLASAGGDSLTNTNDSGARALGFSAPVRNSCKVADFDYLIGGPVPDAETLAALQGAKRVRVIRPGQAVTMDYLPQRLNIETDDNGIVRRLRCG
jgi:hypothetical protein